MNHSPTTSNREESKAQVSEAYALKIAVLGAGGLGSFLGGALARSGEDVTFVTRGNHLHAIRDRGLTVESLALGKFQLRVNATDNPSEIGPVDLVLFCVKSYDTEKAMQTITPLIGNDTIVLSFQNGVDNEDKIGRNRQNSCSGRCNFYRILCRGTGFD